MASNDDNSSEKPNLRPTKRVAAGGKTIFLHHNPKQPSNKSYIHAVRNNADEKASLQENLFGIEHYNVEYSLNKGHRWELLNDFGKNIAYDSSSSSDDDSHARSDSEQHSKSGVQKKKKTRRKVPHTPKAKYRLCELHNVESKAKCVRIVSNTGSQREKLPRKTYMQEQSSTATPRNREGANANAENDTNQQRTTHDVTYYAVVPPPKEKQLVNIRRKYDSKAKRAVASVQRSKLTQAKERMKGLNQLEDEEEEESSANEDDYDDDDELITSTYTIPKSDKLQLNDFIPVVSSTDNTEMSSISENLVTVDKFDPKASRFYIGDIDLPKKFHRQLSREEKLYNRDKAVYIQRQKSQGKTTNPVIKLQHHLMSFSFRTVLMSKTELTIDYLSKRMGKNFIHAQCYPTKYLICLTDRLKSYKWSNNFEFFPVYAILNSYLVLVLNDDLPTEDNFMRVQVGLNMDLFADTIEIENLFESTESIYTINDLIEKTIQFITTLPFDTFKPIDSELSRKKLVKNEEDSDLSESEFLNKQIRHIKLLETNQTKVVTTILESEQAGVDITMEEYDLIKPNICTNCYCDMDETIPMTALKACAHWLCNNCWRQYIETSIKRVGLIICPEWNCSSVVDIGTMLSLVNVRCMSIYERHLEKCLVNVSRSYVQCPSKSCSNIVQVVGAHIDHVRCRCGHRFCVNCKQEVHFPATCSAYRVYIDEVYRNGDLISDYDAIVQVKGRNCISCHRFIEKNGGCNHMTCTCGAEFCWTCEAYWNDHVAPDGGFRCPKEAVPLHEEILAKHHNQSRRFYFNAISHRHQRSFQTQSKLNENAKRLLGTIPLEKGALFNPTIIKSQVDKRESVLRHLYEMVKYIEYLHVVCEYVAVAAEGYGNNPKEFRGALQPLELIVFNMSQVLEGGKGQKAIEQITQLHASSEKIIERLRNAVALRELRRKQAPGYATS